jgi:hypothetical protein
MICFSVLDSLLLMSRPVRHQILTAKLKDTSNASAPELSFQRKAVQDFHARQGQSSAASLTASAAGRGPALSARSSLAGDAISLSTESTSRKRSAPSSSVANDGDAEDEDSQAERGKSCSLFSKMTFRTLILTSPSLQPQSGMLRLPQCRQDRRWSLTR